MCVSRIKGGGRLIGCKICVKAEEHCLELYVKHHTEPLISNKVPIESSTQRNEFKKQDKKKILHNWIGKAMHA